MASPASLKEFRFLTSTSQSRPFTNAASSTWNAVDYTATKLRITAYSDDGLVQEGIPDETLQTRGFSRGANINGLRAGTMTLQCYADGAYENIAVTPTATLMAAAIGSTQSPTVARTNAVDAASTTVNVICAGAGTVAQNGMAILCGEKGDGRGGGEVRAMNHVSAGAIGLAQATNAPLAAGDTIRYSTTTYVHEDASQVYLDHVAVGKGTADQRASIGGAVTMKLSGMTPGELPRLDFEVTPTDHKWIPVNERTSMSKGTAPQGGEPSMAGIGLVHIGDYGESTRTTIKCTDLIIEPNITTEVVPEPGAPNGIGGFQKIVNEVITGECTLLVDEDFGLIADWENKTAKTIIFQMGHTANRTFAIELPRIYLDELPQPTTVGGLKGMKIKFHADPVYDSTSDLMSAPMRIHQY